MNAGDTCPGAGPSSDGLELLHLPASVIVAVYNCLADAGEVVRAATVCKFIWTTISAAQLRQITSINCKRFHPELQHRIPQISQQFPSITTLNLSNCSALPETWLSPAATAWQIRDLDVTRLWHWTGSVCLNSWAGSLTRLVVDETSWPVLEVVQQQPVCDSRVSISASPAAASAAVSAVTATEGRSSGWIEPLAHQQQQQQHQQSDQQVGRPRSSSSSSSSRAGAGLARAVLGAAGLTTATRTTAASSPSVGQKTAAYLQLQYQSHEQQQPPQQQQQGRYTVTTAHGQQTHQQQRRKHPLAWLQQLSDLRELSCRGLVVDPVRCRTHGSSDCQCEESTVLAATLASNPGITYLNLSCNPQLPDRLLHWALTGNAVDLKTLDLSGCDLIRPGYVGSCCMGLQWLDVSGTAAGDADVALIAAGLTGLKHLNLKGCRQVSDAGVCAVANSPSVTSGQLQYLNIGNLTRTHSIALVQLMTAWVHGSSSGWRHRRSASYSSSSSSSRAVRISTSAANAGVHLGLSYTAGASDAVLEVFAAAAAADNCAAAAAGQGAQGAAGDSARNHNRLEELFDHLLGITDTPTRSAAAAAATPTANPGIGAQIKYPYRALPAIGLSGLELAGCNNVSGLMLQHIASLGLLSGLRTLDLSDMEDLRAPKTLSPVTRTAAAAAAVGAVSGGSAANTAAAAAAEISASGSSAQSAPETLLGQMFRYTGSQLTSLTLDGCYVDDQTARFISMQCPRLEHLSVVGCRGLQSAGLQALVNSSRNSSNRSNSSRQGLSNLSLGGSSSAWKESGALSGLTSLTELKVFRRSCVTDAELAPVLAANQQLQKLSLVGCYSLTDDLFGLAAGVQQQQQQQLCICSQLTYLSLAACDGMQGMSVSCLRGLRHLRVSFCASFSKAAVQQLVVACKNLTLLELPPQLQGQIAARRFPAPAADRAGNSIRSRPQAARYIPATESGFDSQCGGGAVGSSRDGVIMPKQGPGGHLHGLKVVCL